MKLGLDGRVVILTGAAGGIGSHAARIFAEEGASVACVDRDFGPLEELVEALPQSHAHRAFSRDLLGRHETERLVDVVMVSYGRIDALVHLAAILSPVNLSDIDAEVWSAHLEANVTATFFLVRAVGREMEKLGNGGRILLASSGAWLSGGLSDRLPYATTKGAVTTMSRSFAKMLGPSNITVNTIAPGLIDTPMMRSGLDHAARQQMESATPLRRFGLPEEVAAVAVFLCSDRASFVSGATINVSGGHTLY